MDFWRSKKDHIKGNFSPLQLKTDMISYILENYVEPSSQIFTDYWKSYDTAIAELNFVNEYEVFTHRKTNFLKQYHDNQFNQEDYYFD